MIRVDEPLHPDFQKILQQFIKHYGKELGTQYFYAWVNQLGLDDTKPYVQSQEKFQWAQSHFRYIKQDKFAKYYKVEAAFPLTSMNFTVYTEYELERAARTLVGKPVNINHESHTLKGVTIEDAEYEDEAVECLLRVLNDAGHGLGLNIQRMIEEGDILQVSIEASCTRGLKSSPEGDVCVGLNFTGLGLLTKDVLPGIPLTRIIPVERIVESFKVISHGENKMKEEEKSQAAEAQWTRAYINDLPDSSFAVIEPAYKSGKTDNKDARHLPYKDANGKVDLPHLSNALARMNQIKPVTDSITADALRAQAKKVLVPLAKRYLPGSQWVESKKETKTEKLATLEFKVSELKRKLQKAMEEAELAGSHLEIKEKAYNDLQVSYGELEREADALKAKLEQLKETHENLLKQHSELTATHTKLRGKHEELSQDHTALVEESEHTSTLLAEEQKAHYDASSEKIQLTEQLTERNNEIIELKTQIQDLKVKCTEKTREISALQEQNKELLERLKKAKRLGKIVVKV
jgi:hypothetical protein